MEEVSNDSEFLNKGCIQILKYKVINLNYIIFNYIFLKSYFISINFYLAIYIIKLYSK